MTLTQLYPLPSRQLPLKGAYLAHNIRQQAQQQSRPYVYSNFVTSLDGRIAIPHPTRDGLIVPKNVANARDWRLFQELAAQADIIISSGRYLRDVADGRAQELLEVDNDRFADLRHWRESQGLKPFPDVAIISGSLQFPVPEMLTTGDRNVVVFTSAQADSGRIQQIEAQAGQVFIAGETGVDGTMLVKELGEMGYRSVYMATGPQVHHLLLTAGVVDRLYLTFANRLVAGNPFATIADGALLTPAIDFKINTIYLDEQGVDGLGQLFVSYDRVSAERIPPNKFDS